MEAVATPRVDERLGSQPHTELTFTEDRIRGSSQQFTRLLIQFHFLVLFTASCFSAGSNMVKTKAASRTLSSTRR